MIINGEAAKFVIPALMDTRPPGPLVISGKGKMPFCGFYKSSRNETKNFAGSISFHAWRKGECARIYRWAGQCKQIFQKVPSGCFSK